MGGADAHIVENTGGFLFSVRVDPDITDYTPIYTVLQKLKPTHLRMTVEPDYNTHQQLHVRTHAELAAYTHTEVREDEDVVEE